MECIDRRETLERRINDRRRKKRCSTIQKIVLLLIVSASIGAAHMLGYKSQQELVELRTQLEVIKSMQQELYKPEKECCKETTHFPYEWYIIDSSVSKEYHDMLKREDEGLEIINPNPDLETKEEETPQ